MDEFLSKVAEILEVEEVASSDDLKGFAQWDSLAVLSVIAMLDANYGVNLGAADFQQVNSAGELWKLVQSKSRVNIAYSSKAPKECRPALEELLFFNPRQARVREGIVNSLEKFGHPRVEDTPEGISIRVGEHQAQTLFAFDLERRMREPVGVVVFLRTSPEDIAIMHVAVHPRYALQGTRAGAGLGVNLIEKVKEIASRIVGVKRIVFFYRREVVIRV